MRLTAAMRQSGAGRFVDFLNGMAPAGGPEKVRDIQGCNVVIRQLGYVVYLHSIMARVRGQGYGTRALTLLCRLADKFNVHVYVYANDDDERVRKFYGRFGFKEHLMSLTDDAPVNMVRAPGKYDAATMPLFF
jgi:hypothetical protein